MQNRYQIIDQAHNVFSILKADSLWTNLEIIEHFNIVHSYNSKEYPFLPSDYETQFLIFSHIYNDAP